VSANIKTVIFSGIQTIPVEVQCHLVNGTPNLTIVGLVDKAVTESKERIRAAIHSLGISLPPKRITINLAPANLEKEGSHFDLPIAIAILVSMQLIKAKNVENTLILGELSLDGRINSVNGILPAAIYASANNLSIICPHGNGSEAKMAGENMKIIAPETLLQLINYLKGDSFSIAQPSDIVFVKQKEEHKHYDLSDIKGQMAAKRAMIIAASGGHNILFNGHPGTGKSMLSSAMMTILPPLTAKEILDVSIIHSVAGMLKDNVASFTRPYRAPHHSASTAAIVGGGRNAKPGEITLAHNGVLFLDEIPEFQRFVLDALRQPLENGIVTISRAESHITYPCKFQLIAAMNPCKCGYFGDPSKQCRKVPHCAGDYQTKISGPIMDRIDIYIEVESIIPTFNSEKQPSISSHQALQIVEQARNIQNKRYNAEDISLNNELNGPLTEKYCIISPESQTLIEDFIKKFGLSMRGYNKVLKVARTIADMENAPNIEKHHVAEALSYRFSHAAAN
jgi:magnesium chelatase family protein